MSPYSNAYISDHYLLKQFQNLILNQIHSVLNKCNIWFTIFLLLLLLLYLLQYLDHVWVKIIVYYTLFHISKFKKTRTRILAIRSDRCKRLKLSASVVPLHDRERYTSCFGGLIDNSVRRRQHTWRTCVNYDTLSSYFFPN